MTRREDYAPYHTMPEFEEGFRDYQACMVHGHYDGVKAQAYDRGAEYAMKAFREAYELGR